MMLKLTMTKDKHIQFITLTQVDNAFDYLTEPKKRRKTNDFICLGRDSKTREFLRQVKMPALPLLADNVDLRKSLESRQKSPLFRVVAGAIALKTSKLREEITLAVKEEKAKTVETKPYTLEDPKDGEFVDENPLTDKEFNALIQQ
jgi:hypothetical protein